MIYLKEFETQAAYNAAKEDGLLTPNVSLITENGGVKYLKGEPTPPTPPAETRIVATFNVTDTSEETFIMSESAWTNQLFNAVEIDGVEVENIIPVWEFEETGTHTVKYTLADPTSIGEYAFQNCSRLTSITIPNSVTSIGDHTFDSCSSLSSITFGNSVTSIGDYAFEYCQNLESIIIPNSVTSIGEGAFTGCTFTSCTIGNGITSIGNYAFTECYNLTSMTCLATTPPTIGSDTFDWGTNFTIYVPAASVDVYKAASGWSDYAGRIQAIS